MISTLGMICALLAVGAIGTNAVELLGTRQAAPPLTDAEKAERAAPASPAPRVFAQAQIEPLPPRPTPQIVPPLEKTIDANTNLPKSTKLAPGSRISQRIKWEMARLKRLAKQEQKKTYRELPRGEARPDRRRPARRRAG